MFAECLVYPNQNWMRVQAKGESLLSASWPLGTTHILIASGNYQVDAGYIKTGRTTVQDPYLEPATSTSLNSWSPSFAASASMTFTSVTTTYSAWQRVGDMVYISLRATGTIGGTPSTYVTATLPLTAKNIGDYQFGSAYINQTGIASHSGYGAFIANSTELQIHQHDESNYAAGSLDLGINAFYQVAL